MYRERGLFRWFKPQDWFTVFRFLSEIRWVLRTTCEPLEHVIRWYSENTFSLLQGTPPNTNTRKSSFTPNWYVYANPSLTATSSHCPYMFTYVASRLLWFYRIVAAWCHHFNPTQPPLAVWARKWNQFNIHHKIKT